MREQMDWTPNKLLQLPRFARLGANYVHTGVYAAIPIRQYTSPHAHPRDQERLADYVQPQQGLTPRLR